MLTVTRFYLHEACITQVLKTNLDLLFVLLYGRPWSLVAVQPGQEVAAI